MNVLVAGGAGYIGSHTVKRLKEAGHAPVIYDNLSRGHRSVVDILKVPAVAADLNDQTTLVQTLREHRIDTVMHFAAYAYVGESVEKPLMYYQNNVATTVSVLEAMLSTKENVTFWKVNEFAQEAGVPTNPRLRTITATSKTIFPFILVHLLHLLSTHQDHPDARYQHKVGKQTQEITLE